MIDTNVPVSGDDFELTDFDTLPPLQADTDDDVAVEGSFAPSRDEEDNLITPYAIESADPIEALYAARPGIDQTCACSTINKKPTADPSFDPSLYSPPLSLWDKGTDFSQAKAWEQTASEVDAKDFIECKRTYFDRARKSSLSQNGDVGTKDLRIRHIEHADRTGIDYQSQPNSDARSSSSQGPDDDLEKGSRTRSYRRGIRRRLGCSPEIAIGTLMIGTIVTLIVVFYAWNVEVMWTGTALRGGVDDDWRSFRDGSHTAHPVKRRWMHSHNDEMRGKDALTLAMSLGFGSIEVDTWLGPASTTSSAARRAVISDIAGRSDDTLLESAIVEKRADSTPDPNLILLTGHKVKDVSNHTLSALYLEPLMARLDENNKARQANESVVGLYADDPTAETQLVIDMKSDPDMTWTYLTAALQPFFEKGYLSTYDPTTSTWNRSALIVVGTGYTPLHWVYHSSPRLIFFDAPLRTLSTPATIPSTSAGPAATFEWDNTIAPMASDKFPVVYHIALAMPPWNGIMQSLRRYSAEATRRGMSSRWWGAARKPRWARDRLWTMQKETGATWVNADDLVDAEGWLDRWEGK